MDNRKIRDRLTELRQKMAAEGIDYCMIPTADYHSSEYVSDYFKVREYFSGFTGSAGTLLVWQEGAALWTDGRYFIQAAKELEGTGIALMKMREEGVPTLENFLKEKIQEKQTLGFDGRVVSAAEGLDLEKLCPIVYRMDPAEGIWCDRPAFPAGEINILQEAVAGRSSKEKLQELRKKLKEEKADAIFLTKLDDIMWLLNIRGCDVECNPVAMSYFYADEEKAVFFAQEKALTNEVREYLAAQKTEIWEYEDAREFLEKLKGKNLLLDQRYCSFSVCKAAADGNEVRNSKNPTELLKAIKSPEELKNMREIYRKDNAAVIHFIYWLKQQIGRQEITEITAADKLEEFRRQIPELFDLSFPTIAGYGPNAAMMHYEATPENYAKLEPKGFLLVDSGGQYFGGTTDITRTISLGPLTEEERKHYTLTAAGMIQMTHAKFLYGCTGRNLDILARQPLWEQGLDYKCGTGHGVGYILNVHEGPQALRWQYQPGKAEAVFEEGMDVTNEPGIYVEGKHGIRIENVMVVQKAEKNENGQFMEFETLTWVPLDRAALDPRYLTDRQRVQIDEYHRTVYEKMSPLLTEEERQWLAEETRPLK